MTNIDMTKLQDLLLSCWVVETARSMVFGAREQHAAESRSAARARILASRCAADGVQIKAEYAKGHAEWMMQVAGTEEETGVLGLIFLQRVGLYVDAHIGELLSEKDRLRLKELAEAEEDELNMALMSGGLKPPPPPEWPETAAVAAPGKLKARIGILGDPHVGPEGSNRMVTSAIRQLEEAGVDCAVAIGDLTENGDTEFFQRAKELFDQSSLPIAVTLGNHDLWATEGGRSVGLERFTKTFDRKPCSVTEIEGVRLIVLNSADPARSPYRPFELMTGEFKEDHPNQSVPGGTFDAETLEWMGKLGPDSATTFIMLHHPPYPYLGMPPLVFGLDRPSTEVLAKLVLRTGAEAVFCGHTHRCAVTDFHGVPAVEVASSNDWPYGISVIELTDQGWSFNLRPISGEHPRPRDNHAGYLFRRYVVGPDEARAFAVIKGAKESSL
jgi:predicted phosphodiesterase